MSLHKIAIFALLTILVITSHASEVALPETYIPRDCSELLDECVGKKRALFEKIIDVDTGIAMYDMSFIPVSINLLAVAPDTSFVASVTSDYTIEIWDSKTRTLRHTLTGISEKICSLAIAPDNSYIVAGAANGLVKVWDLRGKLLYNLVYHTDRVQAIAISEDSKHIATGSKDTTAVLWDRYGTLIAISEKNNSEIKTISFSYNKIVTLTVWGSLKIWNTSINKEHNFNDFNNPISAFALAQNSFFMVTGYLDKKASIEYSNTTIPLVGHTQPISTIAVTHDNTKVITGAADNTVKIWDAKTGDLLTTLADHTAEITKILVSRDDTLLVSCSADNKAHIWQIASGKLLYAFTIPVCAIALASDNSCYIATEPATHVSKLS